MATVTEEVFLLASSALTARRARSIVRKGPCTRAEVGEEEEEGGSAIVPDHESLPKGDTKKSACNGGLHSRGEREGAEEEEEERDV